MERERNVESKRWVLTKRGRKSNTIVMRYFYISFDGNLVYFKRLKDQQPKGCFLLKDALIERQTFWPTCFVIRSPSREYGNTLSLTTMPTGCIVLHLHDAVQSELDYLSRALEHARCLSKAESSFCSSPATPVLPAVMEDGDELLLGADMDETVSFLARNESPFRNRFLLTKRGRISHRMVRRWCEVTDQSLVYYHNATDYASAGEIPLLGSTIRGFQRPYRLCHEHIDPSPSRCHPPPPPLSRHCLEVHCPLREHGPLVIHCHGGASETSQQELLKTLRFAAGLRTEQTHDISDDFKLLRVIGQGGFAKVYLVRKNDTGQIYAMKTVDKRMVIAKRQVEHTLTERYVLQELNHPFIVRLHYAFQSSTKLYFVLDYCPGGELYFHLKRRSHFNEEETLFYVCEIVLALGAIHDAEVIYRDLKPENILLDREGHIRLADFGLCKKGIKDGVQTHTFCGSADYLAPEVVSHTGYGMEIDWWSLGCLTFELLSGHPPFYSGKNKTELYHKIVSCDLQFPDTFSREVCAFIQSLLTVNPECRLGTGAKGMEDVKNHRWFRKHSVNWRVVLEKHTQPPLLPEIRSIMDTHNFDPYFTAMSLGSSPSTIGSTEETFKGFSYRNSNNKLTPPLQTDMKFTQNHREFCKYLNKVWPVCFVAGLILIPIFCSNEPKKRYLKQLEERGLYTPRKP